MGWSKLDKEIWDNSQVMQEFEKLMYKAAQSLSNQLKDVQKESAGVEKALHNIENTAKNLQKINLTDDMHDEDASNATEDESEEEEASNQLLTELREMAKNAAMSGDIKLAYTIERAIQEITRE